MWGRLKNASRTTLAAASIVVAAVLFISVIAIGALILKSSRVDLTENQIYTVSQSTRDILEGLTEPITLHFYVSSALLDESPQLRVYADRITELLQAYKQISGDMVQVDTIDPVPFSAEEDQAIGYNLIGANLSRAGEQGYFGMVGTNSVDGLEVLPVLSPTREAYLEYDLTRMVSRLASPTEPRIGVIDGLGLFGSTTLGREPSAIINRLALDYELVQIPANTAAIPDDIDALLIIHPHSLTPSTLYAIDQYVIRGGPLLAFLDALSEYSPPSQNNPAVPQYPDSNLEPLMSAWGVQMVPDKVVGDLDMALQVRGQAGNQVVIADYPPWLIVDEDNINPDDLVTSALSLMRISSAGALQMLDGATTSMTPLIYTTENSMLYDQATIMRRFDPNTLVNMFEASGQKQILAARITGPVDTAYPDGPPAVDDPPESVPPTLVTHSEGPINVIIVTDADMLADDLNVNQSGTATTQNADFVANALDSMTGGGELIDLRGRGFVYRPFTRVDELEAEAEARYQATEEELQAELDDTEARLADLRAQAATSGQLGALTREQQDTIDEFNQRIIDVRAELRDVQGALRKDIDALANQLRLINILAVPAAIIVIGIIIAIWRRRRLAHYLRSQARA
jgi:ABC-type uncharacterized transport system involved in gliding motility auxiliary subunit